MRNYLYNLKRYSSFSYNEINHFLITAILAGFYFSFKYWATTTDYAVCLANFLIAIFSVLVILGLIILAQKLVAMLFGYTVEYMMSWIGLIVGFFVIGFSNGFLMFFLPGACRYKLIKTARLGKYHSFFNNNELFLVTSMAVVVPLMLTIPFSALYLFTGAAPFKIMVSISLLMAVFSLIPAPNFASFSDWNVRGITDLKLLKKFDGGTYGYDMFMFNFTAYVLLGLSTAIFVFLGLLSISDNHKIKLFSFFLSLILAAVLYVVYKIMIRYMRR